MYKKSLDELNNTLLKLHKIFDFHTFFFKQWRKTFDSMETYMRFVRWLDDEKKGDNKLAETDIDLYMISIIT